VAEPFHQREIVTISEIARGNIMEIEALNETLDEKRSYYQRGD
jgi:hypothetical protein